MATNPPKTIFEMKPSKITSCKNCHQKEYQPQLINGSQKWVRVHPMAERGTLCTLSACTSLKNCNLKTCKFKVYISHLADHPLEVKQLADDKAAKRKEVESKQKEKEERKKQKEAQKLQHPHFTDFKKANQISVQNG
jgi:hypothetical protein